MGMSERINKIMKLKYIFLFVFLISLAGCADFVTFKEAANIEPVGFWYGLWHGMICIFSLLISLFDDTATIYAIYNNGAWYNFGFVIGVGCLANSPRAL